MARDVAKRAHVSWAEHILSITGAGQLCVPNFLDFADGM